MSRSHHATRRDPRDPDDLDRKRRVKALVAEERLRSIDVPPVIGAGSVPITIDDRHGSFVHYPASVDDLRAVIARLPTGAIDGIACIELCLGRIPSEHIPAGGIADEPDLEDPLVGRAGVEIMPGVYSRRVIGTYMRDGGRIQLFAYVYDPNRSDRGVIELYLRLRQLATFMHELGHHRDASTRVARGRWTGDMREESEIYAEVVEHAWTADVVVPYLEDAYPAEVAALRDWMIQHGGIALPLEVLAGDPRTTLGIGGERLFFGVDGAFEQLIRDVAAGELPPTTQIGFANELHYGLNYDEALAILTRVVAEHPSHAGALTLRADIFVHQGRLDEAEAIVRPLVARADDPDPWEVLCDIALARGDWLALREAADRLVNHFAISRGWSWTSSLQRRAHARIELADWSGAAADIDTLDECASGPRLRYAVSLLRALWHLRRGDHAIAHELATRTLADAGWRHTFLLYAVQVEAALHVGLPHDADVPEICERLRELGDAAWAARLVGLTSDSTP